MLKLILETQGYAVTTAASASEAGVVLKSTEFDIVLTDMRMETDTAGYAVVRAAAAQPSRPAIVILTAFPLLAHEWRQGGAHAVLTKPVNMSDILNLIAKLVAHRAQSKQSTRSKH